MVLEITSAAALGTKRRRRISTATNEARVGPPRAIKLLVSETKLGLRREEGCGVALNGSLWKGGRTKEGHQYRLISC